MLYAEYRGKMEKILSVINKILKFRVLIISVLAVIFAAVTALLIAKGTVRDVTACSKTIVFGESIDYSADAFLGDVDYEYRAKGEIEWSDTLPHRIGKFEVRAVSNGAFSTKKYGNIYEFEVLKREVTLDFCSDSVVYGDMPELSGDLATGDFAVCGEFDHGDLTAPSAVFTPVLQNIVVLDSEDRNVTDCYVLSTLSKELRVLNRAVTLTTPSPTPYVYDGNEHTTLEGFKISGGSLAFDDGVTAEGYPTLTSVGSVAIEPIFTFTNSDGADVTHKYDLTLNAGNLIIAKRTINVTTASDSKLYDGADLFNDGYQISPETPLVDGHSEFVLSVPAIRNAGEIENRIVFGVTDGDEDVSANYNFVINAGRLTVTPRSITVISGTPEAKVYDGAILSYPVYTATGDGLVDGHSFVIASSAYLLDAGEIPNEIRLEVTTGLQIVTSNYRFTYEYGTLKILPRKITIVTASSAWTYDGKEHYDGGYTYHESSPYTVCEGEYLRPNIYTIVKTVCQNVDNVVYYYAFRNSTIVNQVNYEITVLYGHLSILPREISLHSNSTSWVYDAKPHQDDGYYFTSALGVAEGQELRARSESSITLVGSIENVLTYEVYEGAENVTSNYRLNIENGYLTVIKRVVIVASGDGEWVYDGAAHKMPEYYVVENSPNDFIEGDIVTVSNYAEITDVGIRDNTFNVTVLENGVDVTDINYSILKQYGTLVVMPINFQVYVYEISKRYDGEPLSYDGRQYEVGPLPAGYVATIRLPDFSVTDCGAIDSGTVISNTEVTVFNASDVDVTRNFMVEFEGGGITVIQANLILVADSAEKYYNGEELTCDSYSVVQGVLPAGYSLNVTVEGSITDVGTSSNVITAYAVFDARGRNVTANFNVRTENGMLTVL